MGLGVILLSLLLIFVLVIVKADSEKQQAALCEIIDANPELSMETCPAHQSNSSWYLTGALGLSFFLLAGGFFLLFIPLEHKLRTVQGMQPADLSKLEGEEKVLCDILASNSGSVYQSDLMKETSWSKVKITRILDKLESKGIVERKRRGMTNIVVLK